MFLLFSTLYFLIPHTGLTIYITIVGFDLLPQHTNINELILGLQNGEIVREKCGELASTEASLAQSDQSVPTDIGIFVYFV